MIFGNRHGKIPGSGIAVIIILTAIVIHAERRHCVRNGNGLRSQRRHIDKEVFGRLEYRLESNIGKRHLERRNIPVVVELHLRAIVINATQAAENVPLFGACSQCHDIARFRDRLIRTYSPAFNFNRQDSMRQGKVNAPHQQVEFRIVIARARIEMHRHHVCRTGYGSYPGALLLALQNLATRSFALVEEQLAAFRTEISRTRHQQHVVFGSLQD